MKNLTDEDLIELAKEDLKCSVIEPTTFNINVWILGYQKCFKEAQLGLFLYLCNQIYKIGVI